MFEEAVYRVNFRLFGGSPTVSEGFWDSSQRSFRAAIVAEAYTPFTSFEQLGV
jgi:hypothetical protein